MINAKTANSLADLCSKEIKQEMFKKTIEEIELCIHESAQKGHYSISYYIPLRIRAEIIKYLEELGYVIYVSSVDGTCWINW